MSHINSAFTSSNETLNASPMVRKRDLEEEEPNPSTDSGVNSETSFASGSNGQTSTLPEPRPTFLPPIAPLSDTADFSANPPPWLNAPKLKPPPPVQDPFPDPSISPNVPKTDSPPSNDPLVPICGCCCLRPSCLRRFAHPVTYLILISLLVLVQSFVVSGYTSSITTTIERRYNIKTTWIGVIVSTYDIACIFATIFVSYYAQRINRARFLGGSTLLLLVGLIVFTIPHFTGSAYAPAHVGPSRIVFMCNSSSNKDLLTAKRASCDAQTTEPWAVYIFILAQVIIGIGASPIYIIGPTYLYDILHPLQYPIYSAFMYVAGALGPALGFVLGSSFLSVYIDWPRAPDATFNRNHSQWLGAWWIGYLMAAGLGLLISLPLLAFPHGLPEWLKMRRAKGERIGCLAVAESPNMEEKKEEEEEEKKEDNKEEVKEEKKISDEEEGYKSLKNLPKAVGRVFVNPIWLFITLLSIEEQFVVSAFVAFIQKYMQTMYGLPAYRASIITGLVVIPSAVVGVVVGAIIVRQMRLNLLHAASFLVGLCVVSTSLMVVLMFMGCDSFKMMGLRYSYNATPHSGVNFSAVCNSPCGCTDAMYSPVCDTTTSTTFFSPCHAGCTSRSLQSTMSSQLLTNFSSCSCLGDRKDWLQDGRCEMNCQNFVPSLIVIFLVILVTSFGQDPAHIITISSVSAADRSFGLGMQVLVIRLFAFVPAPIVFGYIFDSACILWTQTCYNTSGSCREYDLHKLPYVWIGVLIGLKFLGIIFSSCLTVFSKKRATIAISVIVNEAEANKADAINNRNQRVLDATLHTGEVGAGEKARSSGKGGECSVTHVRVRRLSSSALTPRFASPMAS